MIRQSKRQAWRDFTTETGTLQKVARLNKLVQRRETHQLGLVRDGLGVSTETPEASVDALLDAHFPGSTHGYVNNNVPSGSVGFWEIQGRYPWLSEPMIKRAVSTFAPDKAAGPDKIKPLVLKHLPDQTMCVLRTLYSASIALGYVPLAWRTSSVVFIPKAGKDDYAAVRLSLIHI